MTTTALNPDQIAALRALLAEVDSHSAEDEAEGQLSENGIADESGDASTPAKGKTMRRIHGPYTDRKGWRVKVVDRATGRSTNQIFPTEAEAKAAVSRLRRQAAKEIGISIDAALTAYDKHLTEKGNKPRSISSTLERLRSLFKDQTHYVVALTCDDAVRIWDGYTARPTRTGKAPAVDTRISVLHETKTFIRWCRKQGWTKVADPFGGIEILGERSRGKDQLDRVDDARRWLETALSLAIDDVGALAAATALLMGMRASEVTDRLVRDLDDDGSVLVIPHAKTRAGIRRLRLPVVLQPLLAGLVIGKEPTERLFGATANRRWLYTAVRRICCLAKTQMVSPHGLRGTHATLAVQEGVTGEAVARALGHESFAVTAAHYAKAEAVIGARTELVEISLRKFRKSSAPNRDAA
jgi:integrase